MQTDVPAKSIKKRTWAFYWLVAAGIYNLLWGAAVIAAPHALFDWAAMERMRYPEIWQCVGMIVGVYGIGYLIAALNHRVHWPIVLVGLLGKILGPIGFAFAVSNGRFPPQFAATILTNDLIWWIPFGMMLWDAAQSRGALPEGPAPSLQTAMAILHDQHGTTFGALTDTSPTLCVLVRHSGCTFCRETLADLTRQQEAIRQRGYQIAVFTMSGEQSNRALALEYGLEGASWFSDPERVAYRALELKRGTLLQLFGPSVFARGILASFRGHSLGKLDGDGFQMPGAFVIHRGKVIREFRHKRASDKADFEGLACEMVR